MRLHLAFGAIACLTLGLAAPVVAAQVTLPAGTEVKVRLVNPLSSGDAVVGQQFRFQAAGPVTIGSHILITKGASGMGRVVKVSKAHGKSAGEITLAFSTIHAADGKFVALTEVNNTQGSAEKGKASTATIAATIALGPLGLFAHNMVKGKDVTVTPDSVFPAWVKTNAMVNVP